MNCVITGTKTDANQGAKLSHSIVMNLSQETPEAKSYHSLIMNLLSGRGRKAKLSIL